MQAFDECALRSTRTARPHTHTHSCANPHDKQKAIGQHRNSEELQTGKVITVRVSTRGLQVRSSSAKQQCLHTSRWLFSTKEYYINTSRIAEAKSGLAYSTHMRIVCACCMLSLHKLQDPKGRSKPGSVHTQGLSNACAGLHMRAAPQADRSSKRCPHVRGGPSTTRLVEWVSARACCHHHRTACGAWGCGGCSWWDCWSCGSSSCGGRSCEAGI